jgi:hypothetical protein
VSDSIKVYLETTPKKTFASAIDWPGWSRSGKTADAALEALAAYAERYGEVAKAAHRRFRTKVDMAELDVVERAEGNGGTEFGVPSRVSKADARPTSAAEAEQLAGIVEAAWALFDRTAKRAPESLRKGPRGGGRDTSKVVSHVNEADHAYAREVGLKVAAPADVKAVAAMRAAVLDVLREPSDGSPLAGRRWTARYAAHRIAWHALDHAWEIEDRSEPAD